MCAIQAWRRASQSEASTAMYASHVICGCWVVADTFCFFILLVTATEITVWIISALLAIGIGWSKYAKWRTRDKLVRDLAAMDPERREKILSRMNPELAMEARQELMRRFHMS